MFNIINSYITILIICFVAMNSHAQNYYLQVKSVQEDQQSIIDSLYKKQLFTDVSVLRETYLRNAADLQTLGFLFLRTSEIEKINDTLFIGSYDLGNKFDYLKISTQSLSPKEKELLKITQDTLTLPIESSQNFIRSLLIELERKGYPMSSAQLTNHKLSSNEIITSLEVSIDIKRQIDNIYITPYTQFPKGIKKQLLKKYMGKDYTSETIQNLQQEIQQFPFVKITRPFEVLFTDEETILYAYIDKANANRFDGLIGFNSNEDTGKLQFNGHLDIQLANIFNAGEQLKLYWKNDGKQQSTLKIHTEVPYLFSTPFGVLGELNLFRQDSTMQNTKFNAQLLYYISLQNRLGLGIQNTSSTAGADNTYGAENYSNTFYTLSHHFTQYSDHFIFPTRWRTTFQMGYGKRNTDKLSTQQYFAQLNVEKLWTLQPQHYIHQKAEAYYLHSDEYIYNELYRFGGNHSLRGFNENSLLTNSIIGLYNEYRYLLSSSLYIHTITDISYTNDPLAKQTDLLYAAGLGIGFKTGGGLLNLMYAVGKQPNQKFEFKNAVVHLNFVTQF